MKFISNRWLLAGLGLGICLLALAWMVGHEWGLGARAAAIIYGILVTLFLAAQIYGFVGSQVSYSEAVEDKKFEVLEVEGLVKPKSAESQALLPCLMCGVDSGPVLTFFVWLVGAALLGMVCFLIWGWATRKFANEDSVAQTPLELEK